MSAAQSDARAKAINEFGLELFKHAQAMSGQISGGGMDGGPDHKAGTVSILEWAMAHAIVEACNPLRAGIIGRLAQAATLVERHLPPVLATLAARRMIEDAGK